mmetsp:Transcript_22147/g.16532  ORF Transcript_22147/g.16532 Transcript_22147/m.16532 type:complete len:155 (+) Transcript_22147:1944-2408(+)
MAQPYYDTYEKKSNVYPFDEIIVCLGFQFDNSIYEESIRPCLCSKQKFPVSHTNFEAETCKDLYFAGTLTHLHDVFRSASGFIHGFRYNSVAQGQYLLNKYQSVPLPSMKFSDMDSAIMHFIVERTNHASGMFLQQDYISDFLIVEDDGSYTYY